MVKSLQIKKIFLIAFLFVFLNGCTFLKDPLKKKSIPAKKSIPSKKIAPTTSPYIGTVQVEYPWKNLAQQLQQSGFKDHEIKSFFSSDNLKYSPRPMEMKLREIFPLFYKAEITKEIQEKLFQLGYNTGGIDGRAGRGTRSAITRYQKAHGLVANGEPSDKLSIHLSASLKKPGAKVKSLSEYKPPVAIAPSRTSTYPQFTSSNALAEITSFYLADKELFNKAGKNSGVPGEVIASILWIETSFGRNMGQNKAASMLASMAAAMDFTVIESQVKDLAIDKDSKDWLSKTSKERGLWAYNELEALLKYAFSNNLDPNTLPGSIYGAIGWGQFMPSNALKYGVDGDRDGKIDLFNKTDAVYSTGNYLSKHGWKEPMTEEKRRQVIMRYNKSGIYVNTVLFVANHLAKQK